MKVTAELIKKYHLGLCTPEEALAVEGWLNSALKEDSILTDAELEMMGTNVWESVLGNIKPNQTKTIPLYQRVVRYSAAACLVFASFSGGYLLRPYVSTTEAAVASADTKGQLVIYHNNGKSTRIPAGRYDLRFHGSLKLYNGSDTPMFVSCGVKTLLLEPWQTYYLSGSDENHSLDSGRHIANHDDLAQNLSGDFTVLLVAV